MTSNSKRMKLNDEDIRKTQYTLFNEIWDVFHIVQSEQISDNCSLKEVFISLYRAFDLSKISTPDSFRCINPQNNDTVLHALISLLLFCQGQKCVTTECKTLLFNSICLVVVTCPELATSLNTNGALPIDLCWSCWSHLDYDLFKLLLERSKTLSTKELSICIGIPMEIAGIVGSYLGSPLLYHTANRSSSLHLVLDTDQTFLDLHDGMFDRLKLLIDIEERILTIEDIHGNLPIHYLFECYDHLHHTSMIWIDVAKIMINKYSLSLFCKNAEADTPLHKLLKNCDLNCDQTFAFVHEVCKSHPEIMCELDGHNRTIIHLALEGVDEFENPLERCKMLKNIRDLLTICPKRALEIRNDLGFTAYEYAIESWPEELPTLNEIFHSILNE